MAKAACEFCGAEIVAAAVEICQDCAVRRRRVPFFFSLVCLVALAISLTIGLLRP